MEDLEKRCAEAGLKLTSPRRVILKVLSEATDHPSVDDVYARAKALDASVSIATVYRTMGLLDDLGIVLKHDFGGGFARFEVCDGDKHHHLVDTESGDVIEFQNDDLDKLVKTIASELGYDLVDHVFEIYGHKKKA